MPEQRSWVDRAVGRIHNWWKATIAAARSRSFYNIRFWFIALLIGILAGAAAVAFRYAIDLGLSLFYQTESVGRIHRVAATEAWYMLILIPVCGGLAVGLILDRFTPDGRARSVSDVIEAAAINDGKVRIRAGIASSAASLITLTTGGSSGREGPVVHLSALLSTQVSRWFRLEDVSSRDLLGCAVAASVAASFNAPIAGTIFALEVVLRHYAVHAFAPTAIASVAGAVTSRLIWGDYTEYYLESATALSFYAELPAFVILGLVCGVVALVLMGAIFTAEDLATRAMRRLGWPRFIRPAIAGFLLGIIAIWVPQIISVGQGVTAEALSGRMFLWQAILLTIVKIIAVAITFGGRMGGGVFSPSLMVGAMTGLAFGIVATGLLPHISGSPTIYALAGMGAVAAAVLGAPISTALIVFELTGDWQTGLAVLTSVSIASALSARFVDQSFFLTQLERRGVHVAAGPQSYLLATFTVASVMRAKEAPRSAPEEECWKMIDEGTFLTSTATLEAAMPMFEATGAAYIPVIQIKGANTPPELWGALFYVDALSTYSRALAAKTAEAHR